MTETTVATIRRPANPATHAVDFGRLLGTSAWARVHPTARRRLDADEAHYHGVMDRVALNPAGRVLALLAIPFGRPLATATGEQMPITVHVSPTNDGGSRWQRKYHAADGSCVRVESVKRLTDDGFLVECLGAALRMHLSVHENAGGVVFRSTGYEVCLGPVHLALPAWLSPGQTCVTHHDRGADGFEFTLTIDHPLFGRLAEQRGRFAEAGEVS